MRLNDGRGKVGWGDCAPLPGFSLESVEEALDYLRDLGARLVDVLSEGETNVGEIIEKAGSVPPSARFAFSLACANLTASSRGVTLLDFLSPQSKGIVSVSGLITGSPDTLADDISRIKSAGFGSVKLKVGRDTIKDDIERVKLVQKVLGTDCTLRLDANRAWEFEEASHFAHGISECEIEYIEEPLRDPDRLSDFVGETGLPVAIDETVVGLAPGILARHKYAAAVILKPTMLGSIDEVTNLGRAALDFGMTPVISSSFESGVGTLGLCLLAAMLGDSSVPVGLDPYGWLKHDVLRSRNPLLQSNIDLRKIYRNELNIEGAWLEAIYPE